MRKIFLFCVAFVCAMSLQARTIYLNTSNGWEGGDCNKFAAWYFNPGSGAWSSLMTNVAPHIWTTTIPDDQTQLVFCRFNPNVTAPTWSKDNNEYWGKSCDQTIPADKDMFTPTMDWEGGDDGCYKGGAWSVYVDPSTSGYYLAGSGFPNASWDAGSHMPLTDGQISFPNLAAGIYRFKITNNTWDFSLGAADVNTTCSSQGYTADASGNVAIKLVNGGSITIRVVDHKLCVTIVGETEEIVSGKGVPSQCTDVLMQAFYYDSYEVDTAHAGTELYGDTKWKTLQGQAGEIGAYFDLVWLPPSGLASGVGYHPRQYSNQNSDWGTRTELERLISTFHNSGTKVVADIVINHAEAMSGWCDMAAEDFDSYGLFQPDSRFITSTDEVNQDYTNVDTLAGDCWGYSKNSRADDGANWDGARDWAHDDPLVQNMFKAYLQWMKNVIGYDGWRYDKGDGFNNWHMDNYNQASEPYIAFKEHWSGNDDIKKGIEDANMNLMALDFQTKYSVMDQIAGWNYIGRGSGLLGDDYWKRHAVTWVDNHDMFLRADAHGQEFGGYQNSMTEELKYRLLQANAFILSMPGVPCVFYPHWFKYKEFIKPMIDARHLAGVHSESEVKDEYWDNDGTRNTGYQATIVGKNGYLILCLGTKTGGTFDGFTKVASGYHTYNNSVNESYEIWVLPNGDVAPGLIVTPSQFFESHEDGIVMTAEATGAKAADAQIYYTTDGSNPTTNSNKYTAPVKFTQTTTVKIMAVIGTAQSKVQTYTYTYREPLQRGIIIRFDKPESWEKAYIYAWQVIGTDTAGHPVTENLMGAFPGERIYQDADGWYSKEFDADLDSVNFQINSGTDCGGINVKSADLVTDYDACYGWREGKDTVNAETTELDCETKLNPKFDISISPEGGYYRDAAAGVDVTIKAIGDSTAMIYYTTDGSEPSSASRSERGVAHVKVSSMGSTTVKAFAMKTSDRTPTTTKSVTYTYKAPQQGVITVKYQKPEDWEDLYLYAFTRVKSGSKFVDTPYALEPGKAKWPGIQWTTTEGDWYTYTLREVIPTGTDFYVIFNIGSNKTQTQDIYLTENTCYLWNPLCRQAVVDANCDGKIDEGIEEIVDNSVKNHEAYKIILNGRLVIIHNGVMYDVLGRRL